MKVSSIALLTSLVLLPADAALADAPALPHQKLGLWQQTFSMGGGQDISDQVCLDAAAETKLSAFSAHVASKACQSQHVMHNLDGTWSVDSVCEPHPGWKNTSHVVVTGDFNSKYRAVINTTTTGAPMAAMNGSHQSVVTASWLGPCKPGQTGGDTVMSNGAKFNMLSPAAGMH